MLPKPKRNALHAIYAFCRLADDIADDPEIAGDRTVLLARWREELDDAFSGKAQHGVGVALSDAVERFRLPERAFLDLLAGVEFDLANGPIETFDDLQLYCYRVASTVGLLVVRILGFENPRSLEFAETLGIAVQLTNVLRDVGGDASTGRIYLPKVELERFGISTESILAGQMTAELQLMLSFNAKRAASYYERAEQLLPDEDRRALRPATAMGRIYRALLDELIERNFPCFEQPVRLSKPRRVAIAAKVWMGME
jgi:phytoene synthase